MNAEEIVIKARLLARDTALGQQLRAAGLPGPTVNKAFNPVKKVVVCLVRCRNLTRRMEIPSEDLMRKPEEELDRLVELIMEVARAAYSLDALKRW